MSLLSTKDRTVTVVEVGGQKFVVLDSLISDSLLRTSRFVTDMDATSDRVYATSQMLWSKGKNGDVIRFNLR